ncbi:MAG: hypothetical protein AAB464_00730 [Patescibacteria group bacterium]
MKAYEKIAKILRVDKDVIKNIEEQLGALTGKKNVMDKIGEDNDGLIDDRLNTLGLNRNSGAKDIYNALIKKIEIDNQLLSEFLKNPSASSSEDWRKVLLAAAKIAGRPKGFFLKTDKAEEFLKKQPPRQVLKILGYKSVEDMLGNEDIFEVYSSLRFIEGSEWLNSVFFKQYENLKPSDFEYREIVTKALSEKWAALAKDFIRKKHHNISHLKELGVIFYIPLPLNILGETIRNFSLVIHYFNEIPFYSSLFEKFAKDSSENLFAKKIISLLRGDVLDDILPKSGKSQWLIVQRYLGKDDENDWRLFVPHVNPEALHWERATGMLIKCAEELDGFATDLFFWQNLDWVGDYFQSDAGVPILVSFNLVDTAMSLVKQKEMIKYLYHHEEALWNKIFSEYFGEEKMEEIIKENIIRGWFEI